MKTILLMLCFFCLAFAQSLTDEEYQAYISLGSCSKTTPPVKPRKSSPAPRTSTGGNTLPRNSPRVVPPTPQASSKKNSNSSGPGTNPTPQGSTRTSTPTSNPGTTPPPATPAKSNGAPGNPTGSNPSGPGTNKPTPQGSSNPRTNLPPSPPTPARSNGASGNPSTGTPGSPTPQGSTRTSTPTSNPGTNPPSPPTPARSTVRPPRVVPRPSKEIFTPSSQCPVCNPRYFKRFCKKKKGGSTTTSSDKTATPTASPTTPTTAATPAPDVTIEYPHGISDAVKGVLIAIVVAAGVAVGAVACFAVVLVGTVAYLKNRRRDFFSIYDNTNSSKFKDLVESENMMKGEVSDDEDDTQNDADEDEVEDAAKDDDFSNKITGMLKDANETIEKIETIDEQQATTQAADDEFEEDYDD